MLNISPYFGVPILTMDFSGTALEQMQKEIAEAIPEVRKLNLANPWGDTVSSSFKYDKVNRDIDTYNLVTLRTNIQAMLNIMAPNYNAFVFNDSWFNFSNKGNFQFDHNHGTEKFSGVYYYQTTGLDGDIKFTTPNVAEKLGMGISRDVQTVSFTPVVGRMLIFPAYLEHRVEPNTTDHERISITFNIA
jgi:uncharacterized protein (TIGR02466 family)